MLAPNEIVAPIIEIGSTLRQSTDDVALVTMDNGTPRYLVFFGIDPATVVLPSEDLHDGDRVFVHSEPGGPEVTVTNLGGAQPDVTVNADQLVWLYYQAESGQWEQMAFWDLALGNGINIETNSSPVSGSPFTTLNFIGPDSVGANNGGGKVGLQRMFALGGTLFIDFTTTPSPVQLVFTTSRRRIFISAGAGDLRLPLSVEGDTYEVIVGTGAGPVNVQTNNGGLIRTLPADQTLLVAALSSGTNTWVQLKVQDRFAT